MVISIRNNFFEFNIVLIFLVSVSVIIVEYKLVKVFFLELNKISWIESVLGFG